MCTNCIDCIYQWLSTFLGPTAPFDFEIKYEAPMRTFIINKFTLFNHFNLTLFNYKHLINYIRKHNFFFLRFIVLQFKFKFILFFASTANATPLIITDVAPESRDLQVENLLVLNNH